MNFLTRIISSARIILLSTVTPLIKFSSHFISHILIGWKIDATFYVFWHLNATHLKNSQEDSHRISDYTVATMKKKKIHFQSKCILSYGLAPPPCILRNGTESAPYKCSTCSNIICALEIILAIFIRFDCQILLSHAC